MTWLGIQHFSAFVLACIALNLTPGLDTFYILTRSGREGRAVGVAAALGTNTGNIVHTLAATLGISAILMASSLAFAALKYLGAAYLLWFGLRMVFARAGEHQPSKTTGKGMAAAFRQGMLTNVLNPKVALFFLAFLPQFVSMDAAHPQLGMMVLGLTLLCTGTTWSMVLALLGGKFHHLLQTRPRVRQWMDRVCGTVLLAFGLKLALQTKQ